MVDARAGQKTGVAQTDGLPGAEAEILQGGCFGEVFAFNEQFGAKGDLPRSGGGIFGVVHAAHRRRQAVGIFDDDPEGIQHGHGTGGGAVEFVADAMLQQGDVGEGIIFGDAHAFAKLADRGRGHAAAAQAAECWQAGIIPALDQLALDQFKQLALAHDRIGQFQAGEFDLPGREQAAVLDDPVVERTMHLEFEGAHRMGDFFEGVLDGMGIVVHRIDAPFVAGVGMRSVQNPIEHRVAHVQVGRGHVNFGAQHLGAVRELARAHALKQIKVFRGRAVAEGRCLAGFGGDAAIMLPFVAGDFADIGFAVADQAAGQLVHLLEVVGGVVVVRAPIEAQPADIRLDGIGVFDILLDGVGVVHAQVAFPVVLERHAEIQADGLGMADVQIAVGFGREARDDLAAILAGAVVLRDDLADEVHVLFWCRRVHDSPREAPMALWRARKAAAFRRIAARRG